MQPQNFAKFLTLPVYLIFCKIKIRSVKPPEVYDVVVSLFSLLLLLDFTQSFLSILVFEKVALWLITN